MKDERIVYGVRCSWWDSIQNCGQIGGKGLPCCPHCGSVLFDEMENEKEWFEQVDAYEKNGNPGYRKMIEWARGKCFKSIEELKEAYNGQTRNEAGQTGAETKTHIS